MTKKPYFYHDNVPLNIVIILFQINIWLEFWVSSGSFAHDNYQSLLG